MPIKVLFSDNLLASTNLNAKLVPGLAGTEVGPITAPVGLDSIAQHIQTDLPNAGVSTSHARPSMFAHITSFVDNVQSAFNAVKAGGPGYSSLDAAARQDFTEWQGMVAAVALNHIYSGAGLKLSVQSLTLKPANHAENCVIMEMGKYADLAGAKDTIYYICQNGEPFAIFHPVIGLCAMKEYDATIFDGILPWYKCVEGDCHSGWLSITEPTARLEDFCLSRIAWWAGQNGLGDYQTYLQNKQTNPAYVPNGDLAAPAGNLLNGAGAINSSWPGRGTSFGTSMMLYLDTAGEPCGMPELFLDRLMIAHTGGDNRNQLVYISDTINKRVIFKGLPAELTNYAPVVPFREEAAALMAACSFQNIEFDAILEGGKLSAVKVSVTLHTNTGENFTISREYSASQLRIGKLPYLMVWPYLPIQAGLWKQYYATWCDSTAGLVGIDGANGSPLPKVYDLSFRFQAAGYDINRYTKPAETWKVYTSPDPFRYGILTDSDGGELGMIFVPQAPAMTAPAPVIDPVKLSIDFGTTSSVCAMQSSLLNGGANTTLPFQDYSKTVTCEDEVAKRILDGQHWLGDLSNTPGGVWDKKIFSVAQLFQRPGGPNLNTVPVAGIQEYYADGRLFLTSGDAILDFAAAVPGLADPLHAQKIINDMKFLLNANTENYHAASIYLAGLYTYAVLYLLSQNIVPGEGDFIELLVSYPNSVTLNALKTSWICAKSIVGKMMAPSLTSAIAPMGGGAMTFHSEAAATAAYQRFHPGTMLATANHLITMDIGGGTTDISITNAPPTVPGAAVTMNMRKVSVRYAGREIMVESLIEYYRKFSSDAEFSCPEEFASLWKGGPVTAPLVAQFLTQTNSAKTIAARKSLTEMSTLRMYVEMLLADGINMGGIIVGSGKNWPRQLFALKFMMNLRIAARAMKDNLDMWQTPDGSFPPVLDINLSVSGTSAQVLQYIFDSSLDDLGDLSAPIPPEGPMGQCLDLFNSIFYDEMKDSVPKGTRTRLRIFVADAVKDKLEVSHGMLQSEIGSLTIKGAASAPLTDGAMAAAVDAMGEKLGRYPMGDFDKYLDKTLGYLKTYEDIFFSGFSKFKVGLGPKVHMVSDLFDPKLVPRFYGNITGAVVKRAPFMAAPEHKPYEDLLAGMYLVDELINEMMAQLQSK